ncbi:MAG: hypothetical protein KDI44_00795 [Thiothrix sp.]|nr:hypothetical protein [Thiothrix sp.]HPQ94100.1 hypothetical protein [Thiolinea sp.]
MKNLIRILSTCLLLLGIGTANATWADGGQVEVRLIATLNEGPAFQPVRWKVYRVDDPEKILCKSNLHSFTCKPTLPGRYTAVATRVDGETRKRDFYVMTDTTSRVNVPLD